MLLLLLRPHVLQYSTSIAGHACVPLFSSWFMRVQLFCFVAVLGRGFGFRQGPRSWLRAKIVFWLPVTTLLPILPISHHCLLAPPLSTCLSTFLRHCGIQVQPSEAQRAAEQAAEEEAARLRAKQEEERDRLRATREAARQAVLEAQQRAAEEAARRMEAQQARAEARAIQQQEEEAATAAAQAAARELQMAAAQAARERREAEDQARDQQEEAERLRATMERRERLLQDLRARRGPTAAFDIDLRDDRLWDRIWRAHAALSQEEDMGGGGCTAQYSMFVSTCSRAADVYALVRHCIYVRTNGFNRFAHSAGPGIVEQRGD